MLHANQCLAILPAVLRINSSGGPICYMFKNYSQVNTHFSVSCYLSICSENNIDALWRNMVNSKFKM